MLPSTERRGGWLAPLGALVVVGAVLPVLVLSSLGTLAVIGVLAATLLVAGAVVAAVARNRTHAELDSSLQTPPSVTRPVSERPAAPRERSDREVRSGARHLATEPETEEARTLKQRLTEAVSDLADSVEEMPDHPTSERRLTSEQMIARAKQRIAERSSDT